MHSADETVTEIPQVPPPTVQALRLYDELLTEYVGGLRGLGTSNPFPSVKELAQRVANRPFFDDVVVSPNSLKPDQRQAEALLRKLESTSTESLAALICCNNLDVKRHTRALDFLPVRNHTIVAVVSVVTSLVVAGASDWTLRLPPPEQFAAYPKVQMLIAACVTFVFLGALWFVFKSSFFLYKVVQSLWDLWTERAPVLAMTESFGDLLKLVHGQKSGFSSVAESLDPASPEAADAA